jgi:hypothetical protein
MEGHLIFEFAAPAIAVEEIAYTAEEFVHGQASFLVLMQRPRHIELQSPARGQERSNGKDGEQKEDGRHVAYRVEIADAI